ncbi:MAG: hypothetical protein ACXWL2_03385 [Candidatus Chromulinivorax sp.]
MTLKKNRYLFFISIIATQFCQGSQISSTMTHRTLASSPLLYKMIDYSKKQRSFETEPLYVSTYDASRINQNIILGNKQTLIFDQQGQGDFNPSWINLMANTQQANYTSQVTFNPKLTQSGALFHWYDEFDKLFIDIRTALVQTKSQVLIQEVGGGNGLNSGIVNAQQAFTQSAWNYGKIGGPNHVVGLDDVELRFGGISKATSDASTYDLLITGFGIIQAPTGTGSTAEWLFEPRVGTNHWGVGFGFETLVTTDSDFRFMIAGNYRYFTPAWETRSFDLMHNGQWSRYLGVQDTYGLGTTTQAPTTLPLPGINFFTQQAQILGRSQVDLYLRLAKQFQSSYFEISYNLFCKQKESIGTIKNTPTGYGIYAMTGASGGGGGVATASNATINQANPTADAVLYPITFSSANFDKTSAIEKTYATNTIAARLEITRNNIAYGFGAALESALSATALSTWTVWAKFEYFFDNIEQSNHESCSTHHNFESIYRVSENDGTPNIQANIQDYQSLQNNIINAFQDEFIEEIPSFEFDQKNNNDLELDILENPELLDFQEHLNLENISQELPDFDQDQEFIIPLQMHDADQETIDSDKNEIIFNLGEEEEENFFEDLQDNENNDRELEEAEVTHDNIIETPEEDNITNETIQIPDFQTDLENDHEMIIPDTPVFDEHEDDFMYGQEVPFEDEHDIQTIDESLQEKQDQIEEELKNNFYQEENLEGLEIQDIVLQNEILDQIVKLSNVEHVLQGEQGFQLPIDNTKNQTYYLTEDEILNKLNSLLI